MKKKRIAAIAASFALVGTIGIGATLAYFTDQQTATNTFTMGHVDIELTEDQFTSKYPNKTIEHVTPGQIITKDPTITIAQKSQNAYIRAKVVINSTSLTQAQCNELLKMENGAYKYLNIDLNTWKESNGYFYYIGKKHANEAAGVLKAGDQVTLFDQVKIPTTWKNEVADKTFTIDVSAEGIQADNFAPSTNTATGDYGWFDGTTPITAETYNVK